VTRLRERDTSAYDILGVAPESTAEEIKDAFEHLIEEGHYRPRVPLRRQNSRAKQIHEAYATLGDPVARRAYDESLSGERPLWPKTVHHAGERLVRTEKNRQPQPSASKPPAEMIEPDPWKPLQPAPVEYAHLGVLLAPTERPQRQPAKVRERPAVPASPASSSEDDAAAKPVEAGSSASAPATNQRPTSPKNLWLPKDTGRFPIKTVGIVAAGAAVALGSLALFVPTPGEKPQVFTQARPASKTVPSAISAAPQRTQLVQSPPASDNAAAMNEHAELSPSPMADSPRQLQSTPIADAARSSKPSETAVGATEQPSVPTANGSTASGASALPSSAQGLAQTVTVAPSRETPAPSGDQAPASSAPSVAPTVSGQAAASPSGSVIRVPAQWLSGGPTNSDNRHGRYTGTVVVQFTVQPDGRASSCITARGSGNAELDSLTCRLVEERVRFRPALDADGRTIASPAHAIYTWGRRRRHLNLDFVGRLFGHH
jgi:periplasmic protein TonB